MNDYKQIHDNAIVCDLHCDTVHKIKRGHKLGERNNRYHIDIPRLREGGVNFQAFALFVDSQPKGERFPYVKRLIEVIKKEIDANKNQIEICTSATEAKKIISDKKIAAMLAIENGMAIENSLENLESFYNDGIRYMTLTHSSSHDFCSSSSDDGGKSYGLTDFGKDVVRKMNDLGMMVDVSHISVQAFNDVLETTTKPILASHSNAHALCSHDRNLTDDQLKALADNGGVVGMNFAQFFLHEEYKLATDKFLSENMDEFLASMSLSMEFISEDEYQEKLKKFKPLTDKFFKAVAPFEVSVKTVADHIDYIKNLIGPDHIALGSDFDGILGAPVGLEDVSRLPNLTRELFERNYTESDIKKILGGNFIRLFEQISS